MRRSSGRARRSVIGVLGLAAWVGLAAPAYAENEALLRLLMVLRDRGSISPQEYEDIKRVADGPPMPTASQAPVQPVDRVAQAVPASPSRPTAAVPQVNADTVTPLVAKALAGKWYERIGLRGYTQLRSTDAIGYDGPAFDVPNDRAASQNESFVLRRGRFIFSGDAGEHFSLYSQMDFNGSTGAADFSLQMRDLYADVWLDKAKLWRVRLGQSKVPFSFVNLQSSQNRAAFERPDALNSAVEGERDLGASLMWNSATTKQRFRELQNANLKGSGDYGAVAVGAYSGQGLNRSDVNGDMHWFGRAAYPFRTASGQFIEVGVQGYRGRFVAPVSAITVGGTTVTPQQRADGVVDARVAGTFVLYPQPFGVEAEWTAGRGPALSGDFRSIESDTLHGGYVQASYRLPLKTGAWLPFSRWSYYDGARKFGRNAPRVRVNELDLGVEFARWADVELTGMFTHAFRRTRTNVFPYVTARGANRIGVQAQWNY